MCLQGNGSTSSIVLEGERQKVGVGTSHARHRAARQSAFGGAHLLITDTARRITPDFLTLSLLRLVWPGSSLSIGSITLSLRHCCRWLRPDILPWLPCTAPPPPGWSVA